MLQCQVCGERKAKLRVHQIDEHGVAERFVCMECGHPFTVQPMETMDVADGDIHFRVFMLPKEMVEGCERYLLLVRWALCGECSGDGADRDGRRCKRCKGRGTLRERVTLRASIPAGVSPKKLLRLAGEGSARKRDKRRGTVWLHVCGAVEAVV